MAGQATLQAGDERSFARRRFGHGDFALHAARGGQPFEPGGPREIVGAGQHRRGGRHQPGAHLQHRALAQRRTVGLQRHVDPHAHGFSGIGMPRRQHQPHAVLRRLFDPFEHAPFELRRHRPFERRCADHFRARPDQGNAKSEDQPYGHQRLSEMHPFFAPAPHGQRGERQYKSQGNGRHPASGGGQREPCADSCRQRHCQPWAAIEPGARQKSLRRLCRAGQRHALSPRRLLQRSIGIVVPQRDQRRHLRCHAGTGTGKRRLWQVRMAVAGRPVRW